MVREKCGYCNMPNGSLIAKLTTRMKKKNTPTTSSQKRKSPADGHGSNPGDGKSSRKTGEAQEEMEATESQASSTGTSMSMRQTVPQVSQHSNEVRSMRVDLNAEEYREKISEDVLN